jgi:hypothetical protein
MCVRIFPMVLLILAATAATALAGPYYARGSFYAGDGEAWNCDPGNELFDDGLHGDGTAGDGVYGAYVTADQDPGRHGWKIATEDWTENYPNHPLYPMANAILFLINPGEVIHFRLDTNTVGDGWQPATNAVSCSHFSLPLSDFHFEVIGSAPELGEWMSGTPVLMEPELWFVYVNIGEPGVHEFKFRVIGTWDICNLGIHYNMYRGENFTFETTHPLTTVRFEFNPVDGRARAISEGTVGTDRLSWGHLKGLYR